MHVRPLEILDHLGFEGLGIGELANQHLDVLDVVTIRIKRLGRPVPARTRDDLKALCQRAHDQRDDDPVDADAFRQLGHAAFVEDPTDVQLVLVQGLQRDCLEFRRCHVLLLSSRSRRELAPLPPVQEPPARGGQRPAPLLQEKGCAGRLALVAQGPHPLHRLESRLPAARGQRA